MNPTLWKALFLAISFLGGFGGGYSLCKTQWDADVSEREKNVALERLVAQKTLLEEVQNNDRLKDEISTASIENAKIVDRIVRDNANRRLRLPAALCADYGQADTAAGSDAAAAGTGVLPEPAGESLAAVQRELDALVEKIRADAVTMENVLNDICRPATAWAKGQ